MIYAASLPAFIASGLALLAAVNTHAGVCADLSARTYAEFKDGGKPVIVSRCPVPKPLQ